MIDFTIFFIIRRITSKSSKSKKNNLGVDNSIRIVYTIIKENKVILKTKGE